MNKNIFLQNIAKSKINNIDNDYINNISSIITFKNNVVNDTFEPSQNNNNNNIDNNIIDNNNNKYNPDVLIKYNNINRFNNFEFTNNCYKPITSNMPSHINNSNDLIIQRDNNIIDITERYNILYNQRQEELKNYNNNININNNTHINNNLNNNSNDQNNILDFHTMKLQSNNNININNNIDYDELFKKLNL